MRRSIAERFQRFVGRKGQGRKPARFLLLYQAPGGESIPVGHLWLEDARWKFEYDPVYRRRRDLRPLEGFEKLDKVYQSSDLFPFFAVRIPSDRRPDVQRRLREERIDDPDPGDLLRMFGRRAASSPAFELVAK
jgi:HipA-like protein